MYPLLLGKPQTRVKRPLHTDRVILRLWQQAGPKKLFAPKRFQALDLMECQQDQCPYHLSSWANPLGLKAAVDIQQHKFFSQEIILLFVSQKPKKKKKMMTMMLQALY